jgi:hypothetical protein
MKLVVQHKSDVNRDVVISLQNGINVYNGHRLKSELKINRTAAQNYF